MHVYCVITGCLCVIRKKYILHIKNKIENAKNNKNNNKMKHKMNIRFIRHTTWFSGMSRPQNIRCECALFFINLS